MSTSYRYATKTKVREKEFNIHVREMIEMIKNESVKENLYIKGVKITSHAFDRIQECFNINNIATATRFVKDLLKKSKRIGSVLSYDGRINVLYAYDQTALFLSPDLKRVVTINKYKDTVYQPIIKLTKGGNFSKDEMINLHLQFLEKVEKEESQQTQKILMIEKKVSEAISHYQSMLSLGKGCKRKKMIRELISEHNLELKIEGWKLFNIKVEKRHISKSLVSLY